MTFIKKHVVPILLLLALIANIGTSVLAVGSDDNVVVEPSPTESVAEQAEAEPTELAELTEAVSESNDLIEPESEPVTELTEATEPTEETVAVEATEETEVEEATESEVETEVPTEEVFEETLSTETVVEEETEVEETEVPNEEEETTSEAEAVTEAEEVEPATEDIPKRDIIEKPWEIDRPFTVNATRAFATGTNGRAVDAVTVTYLSKDGVTKVAYCIEPGVPITNAGVYAGFTTNDELAAWRDLSYDKKNAIALITAYGYPTVQFSDIPAMEEEKYAATQLMIWEIILGARSPYDFSCSNMYCSAFSSSEWDGLYAVYNSMHDALLRHGKYPTFATRNNSSSNLDNYSYELALNKATGKYEIELKDNTTDPNLQTLPDYNFKSDITGLTITRTSNTTLKIECDPDVYITLPETVTFSAVGKAVYTDCDSTITVWEAAGTTDQKLVSATASRDPIPVYFRIKAPTITKVEVTKKADNGNLIPGAGLQIIDADNKIVAEWETTSDPYIIEGLDYGVPYTLHETYAPKGYLLADDVPFTLEKTRETQYVEMLDLPTRIQVMKVDEKGEPFYGAGLQLLDENGNVLDEWTTDGEPRNFVAECEVGKTYTVHEVFTKPGYILAEDVTITVKETPEVQTVVMKNLPTIVRINKVDENGKPFAGATLQVIDAEGNVYAEWISSTEPYDITGKLAVGNEYILHETATIDGYVVAEDVPFTVKDTKDVQNVKMINDCTKIQIDKVDENGKPFTGATLQILDSEGEVIDEWTTNGEPHRCDKLTVGATYTLHETATRPGYVLADDKEFTVLNTTDVQKIELANLPTGVRITKKTDEGEILEGAILQVIDADGTVIDEWTSSEQPHVVTQLTVGNEYTLHEVQPPKGYATAPDVKFTVADTTAIQLIEMIDEPITVEISKQDISGSELPGASMRLTDAEGNEIDSWTSAEEPHIVTGLEVGKTYILHEDLAPLGYAKASSVEFIVKDTEEVQKVKMIDEIITVEISKKDMAGEELPGASLKLTDKDGNEIDSWTSTEEPHIVTGLEVGKTYILHEDLAPLGYATASSVEFTVKDTGEVQKVEMIDELTKFEFIKVGEDDKPLSNGVFQIIDKEGKVLYEWTSSDKPFEVEGLTVGETYIMHEVTAPKGYELAADIEFTVKDTAETQTITMVDYPVTGDTGNRNKWLIVIGASTVAIAFAVAVIVTTRGKKD